MDAVQLRLNPLFCEEMAVAGIFYHSLGMRGDQHFHMGFGNLIAVITLDQHLFHIICVNVADGPLDQRAFFINQARRLRLQGLAADIIP